MRCTNSVEFRHVRALLAKWMKETDIKINFDTVLSQSLFSAGWLKMAHPRLLNRDSIFNWIVDKCGTELRHKMHLYPRVMFEYRSDGSKALTEVLVIDGAFDAKKEIMPKLFNIKWDGYYSGIAFIPFQVNETYTKEIQISSIDEHNVFCSTLTSEIITVHRPNTIISTSNEKTYRFVDWLAVRKNQGLPTFYETEQIGVTKILVAYFDRHESIIDTFFSTMHSEFSSEYGNELTNKVFGPGARKKVQRSEPKSNSKFFKNITSKTRSNPQDIDATPAGPQRVNGYYGNAPVEPDAKDENAFGVKSYISAAKNSTDHDEVVRLSQLVEDLVTQVDTMKQNMTKEVTGVVLNDVDKKLETMEIKINEKIDEVEKKSTAQFNKISTQYNDILDRMENNNKSLLAAIHGKNVTSSGVDDSARGGAE